MREELKLTNFISFRKNTSDNQTKQSIIMMDQGPKSVAFKLSNEEEFFHFNKVDSNINALRQTLHNFPRDHCQLQTNIGKIERFIKEMTITNKPNISKFHTLVANVSSFDKIKTPLKFDTCRTICINTLNKNTKIEEFEKREENKIEVDHTPVSNESLIENSKLCLNDNKVFFNKEIKEKAKNLIKQLTKDKLMYLNPNINNIKKLKIVDNRLIKEEEKSKNENSREILLNSIDKTDDLGQHRYEMVFPYISCILCDQFNLRNKSFNGSCGHTFCLKCGKAYFEDKVEAGEKNIACPDFKCNSQMEELNLSNIISPAHFVLYLKNKKKKEEEARVKVKQIQTNVENFKLFCQKNVLQISLNNDSIINFSRFSKEICSKCYEPSLFGKTEKNMVKCLNCYYKFCKFCMKEFTFDHFTFSSMNFCKVYFRKKNQSQLTNLSKKECSISNFLYYILSFLISYLLLFFLIFLSFSNYSSEKLGRGVDKRLPIIYLKNVIYFIANTIFLGILLIIAWLFMPFYPVVSSIFK